jgi:UDP-glucuronate 4-epimerase
MAEPKKQCLVTGAAGFIGFHLAKKLLDLGYRVVGIDNFNPYYDPALKEDRNKQLEDYEQYTLCRGDIADAEFVRSVFKNHPIDVIYHMAAQAGVRYSLEHPYEYVQANLVGFTVLLHEAKDAGVQDVIFASSSSVYGDRASGPFPESAATDLPLSLYAATKKSNEVIAHSYHHLFGMRCTGLRFFTVYGPWGRPDMALFSFTKAILEHKPIQVFNGGMMRRDFTYIDDIVDGIVRSGEQLFPWEIINLGGSRPVELNRFIEILEQELGAAATKEMLPAQPGDVTETFADIAHAQELLNWSPQTTIEEGIRKFVAWYRSYYNA